MFLTSPRTGAFVSTVEVLGETCRRHDGLPLGHKERNAVNMAVSHE